ncbi:MAG: hypothetical protein N3I86_16420, partial [Verrucomicrobiae bacterium]|nr:hypothetical protein [Verrucomicrobiae bacterium]
MCDLWISGKSQGIILKLQFIYIYLLLDFLWIDRKFDAKVARNMGPFQIIFSPTSAAELSRMPKELQLKILGEFKGVPADAMSTDMDNYGRLRREGRILYRFKVGVYRIYFEKHRLGIIVHRIL